jgi:biopolymer transport protein TolR
MAFYFSRRKLRSREEDEAGELNIVPYLDVLMNLIIFMLLSMTGLATFGILNVSAPNYGTGVSDGTPALEQQVLSVSISARGFYVAGAGAVLGDQTQATPAVVDPSAPLAAPTVPRLADGTYDFAALNALMGKIKADPAFAQQTKVLLGAEAAVPYETLVQTMDALRETPEKQLLFSDVTLSSM